MKFKKLKKAEIKAYHGIEMYASYYSWRLFLDAQARKFDASELEKSILARRKMKRLKRKRTKSKEERARCISHLTQRRQIKNIEHQIVLLKDRERLVEEGYARLKEADGYDYYADEENFEQIKLDAEKYGTKLKQLETSLSDVNFALFIQQRIIIKGVTCV